MNCPSRPDEIDAERHPDWNQNPQDLNNDATTRADLNGIVNLRDSREHLSDPTCTVKDEIDPPNRDQEPSPPAKGEAVTITARDAPPPARPVRLFRKVCDVLYKYATFVGPGFLIAVAYIDPGNYATDVDAGASTKYRHLFIILMSNLFAIFLQSLCIKLGSVTDIAEVIGSAIALNLLLHIPLVAGCALTILDVLVLMIFWTPDGTMRRLRLFEYFVMGLVLGVMICFCIQLSYIRDTSAGEVLRGYIPSSAIIEGNGIYLSCGILGATVMPHSIFLGSGVVQPRLRHFDQTHNLSDARNVSPSDSDSGVTKYRPSIRAIKSCLKYSITELATSLFTFALFVNSAILIVAGSSLYGSDAATDADLFGIHDLLSHTIAPVAGTLFALALLLSGTSAGIVCTMAGQMVSEGMLNWRIKPWMRRLVTRAISIVPSIIVAAAVGKEGLNNALTASQVVLSVILPFVTAPLLWFTCRGSIMTVVADEGGRRVDGAGGEGVAVTDGFQRLNMRNGWIVTGFAAAIWLVLVVMNVALLVLVGLGKA
ncbi:Manganese transporter SMF1 [Cyphellophora attinorum]|uniref:Manganese transporter SMF1 n=1 Tax=Cyphellophora attinorum TaxID=1664694 RepID=A0A0N0NQK8_9EURO|nr:Manganese transporter SMF1 [Phialophora attinorum]KPI43819.1 Manganese transporter SMF1 [Phialophora attinorum]